MKRLISQCGHTTQTGRILDALGWLLVLSLIAMFVGCSDAPPASETVVEDSETASLGPPRHLILITVDTLRADHLGSWGYPRDTSPNLDTLLQSGIVFERAIAQWPKTGPSFASMFTSRYPYVSGITHRAAVRLPEESLTLPEFFKEQGFVTLGVSSNGVLSSRLGWSAGFDEYRMSWDGELSAEPEEYRRELFAGKVNEVGLAMVEHHLEDPIAKGTRLFLWLHYSDPHAPYILPSDNNGEPEANPFLGDAYDIQNETVDLTGTRGRAIGDHRRLGYYIAQYDANIRVTDRYIRRALDRLEALGIRDEALIVFTSDHGESLGEHGSYFEHGPAPYNTTVHVPLAFIPPGGTEGRRIAAPVEMVDLYPTLIEWFRGSTGEWDDLATTASTGMHGTSRFGLIMGEDEENNAATALADAGRLPRHYHSLQSLRWKTVFRPNRKHGGTQIPSSLGKGQWEFYDLTSDPGETRSYDLSTLKEPEPLYLRDRLLAWLDQPTGDLDQTPVDEEARRALEALGYLEDLDG